MSDNVIWLPIPGFTKYHVSNTGLIKTFNHYAKGKTAIMKPAMNRQGYLGTMLLGDDGKYHSIKVHRMVCLAFHGIPETPLTVNHINHIKSDNRAENLEWMTHSENSREAYHAGLFFSPKGEQVGNSILKEHQVREIRAKFIPRVYGRKKLAEEYGVKPCTIKDIITRRSWDWLK
jgi:hypothetical protein